MAIKNFTVQDAMSMYGVKEWGYGFFGVNSKGHLEVHPTRDENLSCDVYEIVQHLRKKGADTRWCCASPDPHGPGHRAERGLPEGYPGIRIRGRIPGVYPVKCNQIKEVVDQIVKSGYKYRYGLEAGSKPELMIALSMNLHPDALVTCNGYKDETFIKMALLARKAGGTCSSPWKR